ncbi:MAG: TetR/AcrR family transcriptional regulator [Planctomycetota bacterium]
MIKMNARSSRLRKCRRDATREALIEAAERAITRRGYDRTVMKDIARQAGCATGTLYLYFQNKEALLDAIFFHHFRLLSNNLRTAIAGVDNPLEKLHRSVGALLDYFNAHRSVFFLFYTAVPFSPGGPGQSLKGNTRQAYMEFSRFELDVIRSAQRQRLIRKDLPPETLQGFMHGLTSGVLGQFSHSKTQLPREEQMRLLWGFMTGGIGASPSEHP